MFGLQKTFEKQILKQLRLEEILLRVMKEKLADLGVGLTPMQVRSLRKQLKKNAPITLQISDEQVALSRITSEPELEKAMNAAMEDLSADATGAVDKILDKLPEKMESTAESVCGVIFGHLRRSYRHGIKDRHEIQKHFEDGLQSIWGTAIVQLEVLLGLCLEAGEEMAMFLAKGSPILSVQKWIVLSRLHARACQIGGEIVTLLRTGYADGAMARWRSLYEISVVASFIEDHEDDVAEQYMLHDDIEEFRDMNQQADLYPELNQNVEFSSYFNELKARREELLQKCGRRFCEDYGWASKALGNNRVTFRDIEKKASLSHLRPYYREASFNVHAGVRGTFYRLGLHPDTSNDIMLAGASDFGLADPGHLTALSLSQVAASIFSGMSTLDSIVFLKVILKQRDLVGKEFWRAHRKMLKTCAQPVVPPDRRERAPASR